MDIIGRAGLFLEGKVSPELQGVEISITERGAAMPLITVATNEMGAYRYGNRALNMTGVDKARQAKWRRFDKPGANLICLNLGFLTH